MPLILGGIFPDENFQFMKRASISKEVRLLVVPSDLTLQLLIRIMYCPSEGTVKEKYESLTDFMLFKETEKDSYVGDGEEGRL